MENSKEKGIGFCANTFFFVPINIYAIINDIVKSFFIAIKERGL